VGRDAARARAPHRSAARAARAKIFHTKNPHSLPTFLVDGVVVGTWRHRDGHIELAPFNRLDAANLRALREEADRLALFHA